MPGLYEVLVTEGLRARLITIAEALPVEERALQAAEAPDRIAWHLSHEIERALADVSNDQRAEVGIRVARALLDRLGELVVVDSAAAPVDPATVLHAILRRRPDGEPDAVAGPVIPLLDTTLLTNAPGEPNLWSYEDAAAVLRGEYPDHAATIARHVVSSICRRGIEKATSKAARPGKGLSPRTVRYIHSILHAALKDAVRWNLIVRNPADAATPPSDASTKFAQHPTWTSEQLRDFLDFATDSRYLAPWLFIATSGCRRGEGLGLKWDDIDLDDAAAVISRQVVTVSGKMRVKELPKTKRGHMISLDPTTVTILRSWRAAQNEERLFVGAGYQNDGFVFAKADGSLCHPERFSREFDRMQDRYSRPTPILRSRGSDSMASATPGPPSPLRPASTSRS